MSEFSESYHLKSSKSEDAVKILRDASLKGFVFPPQNGWISFLASNGNFEPDRKILKVNPGFLLHYVYAEDHGWSFAFFEKEALKVRYRCDWDDDVTYDDSACSEQQFRKFVADFGSGTPDDVWEHFHPSDIDEVMEVETSKLFAEALGLPHYDWLAYDYMAKDFHKSPANFPNLIKV